jgi:hypothetical protein
LDEVAAVVNLKLAAFLCFELGNLLGNVALESFQLIFSSVLDATNFGRGVQCRSIFVRRLGGLGPRLCNFVHSVMISPNFASK